MHSPHYSQIPPAELPNWNDDDLSGAMWDEAVHLAGGYSYTDEDVAKLPFGFRFVLAEGAVRAHVEGDGLVTAIWNDDGTAMFRLAAACFNAQHASHPPVHPAYAALLLEIDAAVASWAASGAPNTTPRSLEHADFSKLPLASRLAKFEDRLTELAPEAFVAMMQFLRAHPDAFVTSVPR